MTADFSPVNSLADLQAAVKRQGVPGILKTTRMGYDGKGQFKLTSATEIEAAWATMKGQAAVYESFVHLNAKFRSLQHVTRQAGWPVLMSPKMCTGTRFSIRLRCPHAFRTSWQRGRIRCAKTAEALDYIGVLGVEFFVGRDVLYVNEMAPRVHNSGHWTQNACSVSQFEQHNAGGRWFGPWGLRAAIPAR